MDILGIIGTLICAKRREAIEVQRELDEVRRLHAELDATIAARQQQAEEE